MPPLAILTTHSGSTSPRPPKKLRRTLQYVQQLQRTIPYRLRCLYLRQDQATLLPNNCLVLASNDELQEGDVRLRINAFGRTFCLGLRYLEENALQDALYSLLVSPQVQQVWMSSFDNNAVIPLPECMALRSIGLGPGTIETPQDLLVQDCIGLQACQLQVTPEFLQGLANYHGSMVLHQTYVDMSVLQAIQNLELLSIHHCPNLDPVALGAVSCRRLVYNCGADFGFLQHVQSQCGWESLTLQVALKDESSQALWQALSWNRVTSLNLHVHGNMHDAWSGLSIMTNLVQFSLLLEQTLPNPSFLSLLESLEGLPKLRSVTLRHSQPPAYRLGVNAYMSNRIGRAIARFMDNTPCIERISGYTPYMWSQDGVWVRTEVHEFCYCRRLARHVSLPLPVLLSVRACASVSMLYAALRARVGQWEWDEAKVAKASLDYEDWDYSADHHRDHYHDDRYYQDPDRYRHGQRRVQFEASPMSSASSQSSGPNRYSAEAHWNRKRKEYASNYV